MTKLASSAWFNRIWIILVKIALILKISIYYCGQFRENIKAWRNRFSKRYVLLGSYSNLLRHCMVSFEGFWWHEIQWRIISIEIFILTIFISKFIPSKYISKARFVLFVNQLLVLNNQKIVHWSLVNITLLNTIIIFEDVTFSTGITN